MLSVCLIIWRRRKVTFSSKIDAISDIIKTPLFDRMHKTNDYANIYSPKESSLKNSTRGLFGFECLSITFSHLDFILIPNTIDVRRGKRGVGGRWHEVNELKALFFSSGKGPSLGSLGPGPQPPVGVPRAQAK